MDLAGPFMGQYFLIIVDTQSKWPEAIPMSVTTAETAIREMRKIFAVHGLPSQIFSDNGPQFSVHHFKDFLKQNGIKHNICSAPYHPATSREAERFIQAFKNAMKSAKYDSGTLRDKVDTLFTNLQKYTKFHKGAIPSTTAVS